MKEMSMEELLALQEQIGVKAFSAKLMKTKKENKKKMSYKRQNKNRPIEMPLQRRPAPKYKSFSAQKVAPKSSISRDPRFDDLSGKLDVFAWKKNYDFISNKRSQEVKLLKKQLKKEKDPSKIEEIEKVIQRMKNQEREQIKLNKVRDQKKQLREETIASLKAGKAPKYTSKKESALELKMSHFNQLKNDNKVNKYIKRKEKKNRTKEF
ncbi:UNVERIFIED_CONTAM: hypothetical protein GTU68_024503 [Idotea baltica]|nr:hypothetical protein [Idotea baltica]